MSLQDQITLRFQSTQRLPPSARSPHQPGLLPASQAHLGSLRPSREDSANRQNWICRCQSSTLDDDQFGVRDSDCGPYFISRTVNEEGKLRRAMHGDFAEKAAESTGGKKENFEVFFETTAGLLGKARMAGLFRQLAVRWTSGMRSGRHSRTIAIGTKVKTA